MSQATFEISGMSCGHCVKAVDKALQQTDGVRVQNVAIGTATVEFDPSKVDTSAIARVIDDAGFQVTATR